MSGSAPKRQRTTPRSSAGPDFDMSTPHADLQRLAGVIPKPVTPFRRAISTGPDPGSRRTPNFTIRTPGTGRTPRGGPATRPIPARRNAPTTPHAIRALRERANAARTPGHNRRRSGRIQRETPRDILRDLSRALAPISRPVESETRVTIQRTRHSALDLPDVEDGQDLTAPRLSMPLDDMYDDDSFHEAPPRQSLLPELPDDVDNTTMQSLEFGRRALSEDPRYAGRVSERFAEMNDLSEEEEYEVDGTFINRRRTLGVDQLVEQDLDDDALGEGDTTMEIRALTGNRSGRQSDVNLGVFDDEDDMTEEPTFRFMIPERMRVPVQEETQDEKDEEPTEQLLDEPAEEEYTEVQFGDDDIEAEGEEQTARLAEDTPHREPVRWDSPPEEDDIDLTTYREEPTAIDRSLLTQSPERTFAKPRTRQRRALNISKCGLEYPSFPNAPVKALALGFMKSQGSKAKLNKETLAALVQSTDFFFEQIGEDLAAYSQHGGRKTIEESDVIALMKRTRQITSNNTSFSLAQKMLPRELLQQLRMEPLPKVRQKRKRMETIQEEEEGG